MPYLRIQVNDPSNLDDYYQSAKQLFSAALITTIDDDFNLQTTQQEVGEWVARNFDNRSTTDPLMGLFEEVGELAHTEIFAFFNDDRHSMVDTGILISEHPEIALLAAMFHLSKVAHHDLKKRQGIRGTATEHDSAMSEHILVLSTYLNHFSQATGIEAEGIEGEPYTEFSEASNDTNENEHSLRADAVGDISVYLMDYCARRQLSLQEAIFATWSRVKQRDWNKHRKEQERWNQIVDAKPTGEAPFPTTEELKELQEKYTNRD